MAILGRVQTRDPDPGHFGPDFDSGSGHGSTFTDPGSGCLPESTDHLILRTVFTDLRTLFGLKFYLKKICLVARFEKGELCVKSGLKQEKLSVRPFKLRSSFLHE